MANSTSVTVILAAIFALGAGPAIVDSTGAPAITPHNDHAGGACHKHNPKACDPYKPRQPRGHPSSTSGRPHPPGF